MSRQTGYKDRTLVALAAGLVAASGALAVLWPVKADRNLVADSSTQEAFVAGIGQLSPGQRDLLIQRETQRLVSEPLDISAYNNLSILKALGGDAPAANAMLLEAASRTLHDPMAQLAAMRDALSRNQYADAFHHMDGLLTTLPAAGDMAYPLAAPTLMDPTAAQALADVLSRNPPWRKPLFAWLEKNGTDVLTSYKLVEAMRKAGVPGTEQDLRYLLTRLIGQNDWDQAYYLWLDSLSAEELSKVRGIYDGQFSQPPQGLYFDWTLASAKNATISIVPDSTGGQHLRVDFANSREAFGAVYQYLKLAPGDYTLSGNWEASNLTAIEGLAWHVACMEGGSGGGQSARFKANSVRANFSFAVHVPDTGCGTQKLVLSSATALALEWPMDGQLSFGDLKVAPAGGQAQ